MTLLQEVIGKLETIELLLKNPTEEEKKDKPDDGRLIKRLKEHFRLLKTIDDKDATILAQKQTITYRDNEITELKKRPTQDAYDRAVQAEKDKYSQFRSDISTILYPDAKVPALAKKDEDLVNQSKEVVAKLRDTETVRDARPNITIKLWTDTRDYANTVDKWAEDRDFTEEELHVETKDTLAIRLIKQAQKGKAKVKEETGFNKENKKLIFDIINLDFHDTTSTINASCNIQTETFYFPISTTDSKGEPTTRTEECRGVMAYGGYDDIKVLEKYGGKTVDWGFDTWKIVEHYGSKCLHVRFTPKWKFVEVAHTESQTELTMAQIAEMEKTVKSLSSKLTTEKIIDTDTEGGKSLLRRLEIVERGVSTLEEDKKHNIEEGKKMKVKLQDLENEVNKGNISKETLEARVDELEELVKKKETEYQKSLVIKEEEWESLNTELNKVVENFEKNNKELNIAKVDKEELELELTAKGKELVKTQKELEQKNKEIELAVINNSNIFNELEKAKKETMSDYEKEICGKINSISVSVAAFLNSVFPSWGGNKNPDEDINFNYLDNVLAIKADLEVNWNETKTPNIPIQKTRITNDFGSMARVFREHVSNLRQVWRLEKDKADLEKSIREKDIIIEKEKKTVVEKRQEIVALEKHAKDREELIRVYLKDKEVLETEKKEIKRKFDKMKQVLEVKPGPGSSDYLATISSLIGGIDLTNQSKLLYRLHFYRNSGIIIQLWDNIIYFNWDINLPQLQELFDDRKGTNGRYEIFLSGSGNWCDHEAAKKRTLKLTSAFYRNTYITGAGSTWRDTTDMGFVFELPKTSSNNTSSFLMPVANGQDGFRHSSYPEWVSRISTT